MHSIIIHFARYIGLTDINGAWYAFWSGIGSDLGEFGIVIAVIHHMRSSHRQRSEQAAQLHNHINQLFKESQ
jgi:hypothetical protein